MASMLDQLLQAGESSIEGVGDLLDFLGGDIDRKEYKEKAYEGRAITEELFRGDETVYSPKETSTWDEDLGWVNYGHIPNVKTQAELDAIKKASADPEAKGKYYKATYGDLVKEGYTSQDFHERHPLAEALGWKLEEETPMKDAAHFERLVHGQKQRKEARAYPTAKTKAGGFVEFEDTGLAGGSSEVYMGKKLIEDTKDVAVETAIQELDVEQTEMAKQANIVAEEAMIKLDEFVPTEGTATQAPVEEHFKTYSLKEQEARATALEKIDEERGGTMSPEGAGSYESILEDPAMKQLALDTYKDLEGEDISKMKEDQQLGVLKTFASEQSNNITKMLMSMTNKDTRKARRLSAFLRAYRSSDLTAEQFAEGAITTVTDPMTYATGGVGGLAAKPIIKAGMKKALTSGAVDAALTGLAQSVAEQTREKTAGHIEEISGKEVAKHMGISMALGMGMSGVMQKLAGKDITKLPADEQAAILKEIQDVTKSTEDVAPDSGFGRMFETMGEEKPKEPGMEGMFGRMEKETKVVGEDPIVIDKEGIPAKVIHELEEEPPPEIRQKEKTKEEEPETTAEAKIRLKKMVAEAKERKAAEISDDDGIKYKNKVMNLVNQRLLPESVEGAKRDAPITSKGVGDIYEYQTQGRLSGQALAEKSNRTAEILSIEEGSTKKFTDDILEARRITQEAPKKGEHPLKRDLDTTNLIIDSLNGRRFVLEDSGKSLKGKALVEHQVAMEDLVAKRKELKTKMADKDVEVVARREYGKQFEKEADVETFDFSKAEDKEIDALVGEKLASIKKEHKYLLKPEQLTGKISKENSKEIDSFLNNLESDLNTRIQETRKEKGDLTVSTTALGKREKSLINQIKVLQHDRANGMPDNLYKAELADIFIKHEGLDYTKKFTEEKFSIKKARTQELMKKLDIVIRDATEVKPKPVEEKKVSYKDRRVMVPPKDKKPRKDTTKTKLDKIAKENKWTGKEYKEHERDAILDSTLERDSKVGDEERSWSKILKEAIDENIITRREAKDIVTPKRIKGQEDRGIFDYNEFRAEQVARVAEKLNKARAKKDLGIELEKVKGSEVVSQADAIDSVFSNIQIAAAMTGDKSGFKAIGALGDDGVDLRGKVAREALAEVGISEEAMRKLGEKVDKIAKLALGNKAYTEGEMSVVSKLSSYFKEAGITVSTKKLLDLYQAIQKSAKNNNMGLLDDYAGQIQKAVKTGRIEPVLKFKNFDGTMENIKVHTDVTKKAKFLGKEEEILVSPTAKDTQSGKVASLMTQAVDAFIERAVRKAVGYKGTASVFDAFIVGDPKKLPLIEKAVKDALKTINDKGGLAHILNQIDPKGNYKDAPKIDFDNINAKKLLDKELTKGETKDFIKKIETSESFLMSNTGMAINSMLEGTVTNKRGLDALRESVSNAKRIVEHTPEEVKAFKELGYTDEQIGKRSDLEYSRLDKLAGQVLKASTKEDLKAIVKENVSKGLTRKQTSNWTKAIGEIVKAQRRFMEGKADYEGKRLFVSKNGEDIGTENKSLVEFFNELSAIDKETLGAELNSIDRAREFVRTSKEKPKSSPERQAVEAKNIIEAEKPLIQAKPESKPKILEAHALKAKDAKGRVEVPEGLNDRYQRNKKLKESKQCAN